MMSLNLFNATHLPARETIRKFATRLPSCLGITFFIVDSPVEVERLVERVYSYCDAYNAARGKRIKIQSIISDVDIAAFAPLQQPPTAGEICELLAMAAVGAQYDAEASVSLRVTCFHSARFGLEDAMEEAEEGDSGDDACYRILRLLALLAVYQILEKRGSCWWYIETALNIAKARNLDYYSGNFDDGSLEQQKRVRMRNLWGTLVCLESWIGATLGKVPSTKIDLDARLAMRDPVFCYREDPSMHLNSVHSNIATRNVQIAIVRIAVLTAAIQQSLYPVSGPVGALTVINGPIDFTQIYIHKNTLNQWSKSLPPMLQLDALLGDEATSAHSTPQYHDLTFAQRSSMLLGHCLSLSATMLLTRRIFLSVVNDPAGGYATLHQKDANTNHLAPKKKEALEFVSSSLMAANTTGRIVGLMVREGRLVSKCWMAIYATFNACLLLLFHINQRSLLYGESNDKDHPDMIEIIKNITRCLSALEFCAAGGDALSKWYLQVLAPFRKILGEDVEGDIRRKVARTKPSMPGIEYNCAEHTCSKDEVQPKPPSPFSMAEFSLSGVTLIPGTEGPDLPSSLTEVLDLLNSCSNVGGHTIPTSKNEFPAILAPISTGPMSSSVLSTNIYNILAVSAQGSFRLEDLPGNGISDIIGSLHASPAPLYPESEERTSSSSSGSGSSSGTPSTGSRSSFPTLSPSDSPNPFSTVAADAKGEKRGSAKHSSSPQPTEPHGHQKQGVRKHAGDTKRVRLEPYNEMGFSNDKKQPTMAEMAALLNRAA